MFLLSVLPGVMIAPSINTQVTVRRIRSEVVPWSADIIRDVIIFDKLGNQLTVELMNHIDIRCRENAISKFTSNRCDELVRLA